MTKKLPADFRLRITGSERDRPTYLVRSAGEVSYISAAEVPLALSNLAGSLAAELRFALVDAEDGSAAAPPVRRALAEMWGSTSVNLPQVEVLL